MEHNEKHHDTEFVDKLMRSENNGAIRNVIIFELVIGVVWGLASRALNDGGLMAVVNIFFLIVSLILAGTLISFLRSRFSVFISSMLSALIWVLIFGVMRGLF